MSIWKSWKHNLPGLLFTEEQEQTIAAVKLSGRLERILLQRLCSLKIG